MHGDILVRDLSSGSAPIRQVMTSHGYGAKLVSGGKPGQYLLLWTSGRDGARHVFSRPLRL